MGYPRSGATACLVVWMAGCGNSSTDAGNGGSADGPSSGPGSPAANGSTVSSGPGGNPLADPVAGEYNLGPVEWQGSFNNACSPYPATISHMDGELLAGLSDAYAGDGSYCDACIKVVTAAGKEEIARVVTYGQTTAPGNIDVSQAAFDALTSGEYPRTMTWQLVSCPDIGPLVFQFQTGANVYWTSLWVRNPRIAVDKLEVQSANHASFTALERGSDGTFTDAGGFGEGAFTLRITGVDGSSVDQAFASFQPGDLVSGTGNL
jgi:hypothetical protein